MRPLLRLLARLLAWALGNALSRRTALVVVLAVVAAAALAVAQFDVDLGLLQVKRENSGPLGLRLGLDLQGGTHLVYQAVGEGGVAPTPDQMEGVRQIIERRINPLGVTEPVIQVMGEDRVLVQLPGLKDVEETKRLIGETAVTVPERPGDGRWLVPHFGQVRRLLLRLE